MSYQWYRNTTDSDIGAMLIDGAISDSYSVPTGTAGTTYYYVVVTNSLGEGALVKYASTPSFRAAVVVNAPANAATPVIGTQPTGATVTVGDMSPAVSVVATKSDSGTLSYQWYTNTTSSNAGGTLITEATNATYSIPTGTAGTMYYYVVVTNTNGAAIGAKTATATSSVVEVVVNAAPLVNAATPVIGTEPTGGTVTVGDVSPTVSVVATASGAGNLSYQWYSNATDSETGGTLITGETSSSYSVPTGTAGTTYYYVEVTNTNVAATGSKSAKVTSSRAAVMVNELTYTVSFNTVGGSTITSLTGIPVGSLLSEPAAPTKAGYTFEGWYKEASLTTEWSFTADSVVGDTMLYAQWTANLTYTIAYDGNESTGGSVPVSSSYEEGATATVAGNTGTLVKAGHTFNGWNTKADGAGTPYAAGATFTMGAANLTLYAQWTTKPTHTVTYDGNESTGGSIPVSSSHEEGATATVAGNTGNLVKVDHNFNGWNTKADGSGDSYTAGTTFPMGKGNLTLYAQWSTLPITPPIDPGPVDPSPSPGPVDPSPSPGPVDPSPSPGPVDPSPSPGPVDPSPSPGPVDPSPSPGPVDPSPVDPPAITFTDLSSNWAQEMIEDIAGRGIIHGYPDGTFRPNEPITRQHVALMLTRALQLEQKKDGTGFTDVSTNHPYYEAIKQVQQAGIFEGNKGNFNPNANMTRAQMAKVIVLAFALTSTDTQTFKDVPSTHWAHNYIAILAANGIAFGDNGGFKPEEPVTRAQFAAFLYRVLNK